MNDMISITDIDDLMKKYQILITVRILSGGRRAVTACFNDDPHGYRGSWGAMASTLPLALETLAEVLAKEKDNEQRYCKIG